MYLLDSNIFLEMIYVRTHASACHALLSGLDDNRCGWITAFSVHAIEAILGKKSRSKELSAFLENLMGHPYLKVHVTSLEEEAQAVTHIDQKGLDFDDALQYTVAKNHGLTLVTFDRDFDAITDIPVCSPLDLVN